MVGNPAAAVWMSLVVLVTAGFAEETVYGGWMFEAREIVGNGAPAKVAIMLLTSALFAAAHIQISG
jgi:membrane protease YdiL (CAAX protease family)